METFVEEEKEERERWAVVSEFTGDERKGDGSR